jgi:hypothetical protein
MAKRVAGGERHRLVWRVSAATPQGEYVDPDAVVVRPVVRFDRPEPGWLQSSFELLNGLEITEEPGTMPPDVFDKWFRR